MIRTEFPPEERRKRTRRPRPPSNPTRSEASSHYPTLPPREQNPEIDRETSTRSTDPGEPKHEERGGEQGGLTISAEFRSREERRRRRGDSAVQTSEQSDEEGKGKRGGAGPGGKSRGGGSSFDEVTGLSTALRSACASCA